jgi:hypothetical protein
VKAEIRNNKKANYQILKKDANREAQARFREKNKEYKYIGNILVDLNVQKKEKELFMILLNTKYSTLTRKQLLKTYRMMFVM